MTIIEDAIVRGAVKSYKAYIGMTGYELYHAPEHFIETMIALELCASGYYVFSNASLRKIREDIEESNSKAKKMDNLAAGSAIRKLALRHGAKRPDLTVFRKTSSAIAAVVEIKRSWSFRPVKMDAEKIERIAESKEIEPQNGYIVVYSDAKRMNTLPNTFENWAKRTGWTLHTAKILTKRREEWQRGFCVLHKRFKSQ